MDISYCNEITGKSIYSENISEFHMCGCKNIIDENFKDLGSTQFLNISCCDQLTDKVFDYLYSKEIPKNKMIHALYANNCKQITNKIFENKKLMKTLNYFSTSSIELIEKYRCIKKRELNK